MEFKSLIISMVGFQNFFCCLAWAVDLGVQITVEGKRFYIGSFCPAMTSLSRYLEGAALSISMSSNVFIFLWLFSRCIIEIVSSIVFNFMSFLKDVFIHSCLRVWFPSLHARLLRRVTHLEVKKPGISK